VVTLPSDSRILPYWTVSRTDYPSITFNLHCTGTSFSLWCLWWTKCHHRTLHKHKHKVTMPH